MRTRELAQDGFFADARAHPPELIERGHAHRDTRLPGDARSPDWRIAAAAEDILLVDAQCFGDAAHRHSAALPARRPIRKDLRSSSVAARSGRPSSRTTPKTSRAAPLETTPSRTS